mgnify:CR=1 FL=1
MEKHINSKSTTADDFAAKLDAALDRGKADADAGRVMEVEEAFERLRRELSPPPRQSDRRS